MKGKTRSISVTSGKGGVGKTTVTANLAMELARRGEKVLILDGDLGMANVEIFFGVRPNGTLGDVLAGRMTSAEALTEVSPGIFLLSGGTGVAELAHLNHFQRRALLEAAADLPHDFGWMVIDTATGISDNVLYLNAAADEILVLLTPDPASFADAYALVKTMSARLGERKFSILCNQVRDGSDGFGLFRRFQEVVHRFLDVSLDYRGSIPFDIAVKRANQNQSLILRQAPMSSAAEAIRTLTAQISKESGVSVAKGGLQTFWRQVAGVA